MSGLILNDSMDAKVWAKEFVRQFENHVCGANDTIDEEIMVTWFASALLAGFNEATRKSTAKVEKLAGLILLVDPVVSAETVNDIALTQWSEFIRCFPEHMKGAV